MNWSLTYFTLIRFACRSFTWSKSFIFNNFQYTEPGVNGFSATVTVSTQRVGQKTLSNFQPVFFLLHSGVHWRLCVVYSFQYFLNKVFCCSFFDLTFFETLTNKWQVHPLTTESFFLQLVFVSFAVVL